MASSSSPRWILITDVSNSIGLHATCHLLNEGFSIIGIAASFSALSAVRSAAAADASAPSSASFHGLHVDLSDPIACDSVLSHVRTLTDRLFAVVHNSWADDFHCIAARGAAASASAALDRNVRPVLTLTHLLLPLLLKSPPAPSFVIFVSSLAAISAAGLIGGTSVAAARFAIRGFSQALFFEYRDVGLKVTHIATGPVRPLPSASASAAAALMSTAEAAAYVSLPASELMDPAEVSAALSYTLRCSADVNCLELILQTHGQPRVFLRGATERPRVAPYAPAAAAVSSRANDRTRRVAFITGASAGIGRAMAVRLAERGFHLALLGRSDAALAETAAAAAAAAAAGASAAAAAAWTQVCDVRDTTRLLKAFYGAVERFGHVDVVIPNAGISKRRSVVAAQAEVFDAVLDTNLRAAVQLAREVARYFYHHQSELCAAPLMPAPAAAAAAAAEGTRGHVVFVGSEISDSITRGAAGVSPYYASKFGLLGFANCMHEDVRELGVKVTSLLPSLVRNRLGTRRGVVEMVREAVLTNEDVVDAMAMAMATGKTANVTHVYLHPQLSIFPAQREFAARVRKQADTTILAKL